MFNNFKSIFFVAVIYTNFNIFLGEPSFGIYYSQLGYARTMPEIRTMMEQRTGVTGKALRIEHAIYCNREGKSQTGCPVAKEVSF